jgi:hypothetical protein
MFKKLDQKCKIQPIYRKWVDDLVDDLSKVQEHFSFVRDFYRVECKRAIRHIAIQDQSCSKPWATFVQRCTRRLHKYDS